MNASSNWDARVLDAAVELLGRAGRRGIVRVQGDSMRPTLDPGSLLLVDFNSGPLVRGDLVVFRQADYLVVHRYLGPARMPDGSPCLRTRGDARIALDPAVDPSSVVGRIVATERGGCWRAMSGKRARRYALAVAVHDYAWAAVAVLGAKVGIGSGIRSRFASIDRRLLRLVDRLLFERVHEVIPCPPEAASSQAADILPPLE